MTRTWWPAVLAGSLAAMYGCVGLAAQGPYRLLGIAGAVLVLAALAVARRSLPAATLLLALGAVPLPAAAWWSILAPLLGLLTLPLGWWALRAQAAAAVRRARG